MATSRDLIRRNGKFEKSNLHLDYTRLLSNQYSQGQQETGFLPGENSHAFA